MITIHLIQKRTAEHFGLSLDTMLSKRKPEHIVFPRQVAMFLARELTGASYPHIGEEFGGKDHSVAMWGDKRTRERIEVNPKERAQVAELRRKLELELE